MVLLPRTQVIMLIEAAIDLAYFNRSSTIQYVEHYDDLIKYYKNLKSEVRKGNHNYPKSGTPPA